MRTELEIKLELARNMRAALRNALLLPDLTDKARAIIQDGINTANQFIAAHYIIDEPARDMNAPM